MRNILFLSLFLFSCSTVDKHGACIPAQEGDLPCKPKRAGMIPLNRAYDSVKPLGVRDLAGQVLVGELMITSPAESVLQGVSLRTKESIWTLPLSSSVTSPLVAQGPFLVVGLRDGTVLKLEAATGKKLWSQKLGRYMSREAGFAGGKILVTTVDQKLFALDFKTGKTHWIYNAGMPTGIVMHGASKPIVMGSLVLLGTSDGELHGVDVDTGKSIWSFSPGSSTSRFSDVVGEIAVQDGNAIVSRYDGTVFAVSVATGMRRILWKKTVPIVTSSYYRNGVFFVGCLNGEFLALDGASGRVLWTQQLGQATASITPGEKVVYIAGTKGQISALDASNGGFLWADSLDTSINHSPILWNDILYFGTSMKVLYGYKVL